MTAMKCEEFQEFADLYVDGEFDIAGQAEVDAHLADCPSCREVATDRDAFRLFLKRESEKDVAPIHLTAAISKALDRTTVPTRVAARWTWRVAGAMAALLLLVINVFPNSPSNDVPSPFMTDPIVEASVDWHRRNMPVEVTGPDADVIREWFMSKVDFPVRLPNFEPSLHANALGGRLSHLNNQSAAHVLYEIDGLKVSVILFEEPHLRVPTRARGAMGGDYLYGNRQGYNVAVFRDNGVTYAITTEIPQPAFREMVNTVNFNE